MGNKAKLRAMTLRDLDEVLAIEVVNFSSPWFKEHYEYELKENPFAKMTVLLVNRTLVGYMGVWILFEEAQLTNIAIKKEYQGNGYGEQLLRECMRLAKEAKCERVSLEVRVSNVVAQNLYRKFGFDIVSVRPQYYEDNQEDAYLMLKGI